MCSCVDVFLCDHELPVASVDPSPRAVAKDRDFSEDSDEDLLNRSELKKVSGT